MKIAICDDDKAARGHIVSLVKEQIQDAEIMSFATGEEMLKVKNTFDISFLDVEMREVSGMDVANHIRQKEQDYTSWSPLQRDVAAIPDTPPRGSSVLYRHIRRGGGWLRRYGKYILRLLAALLLTAALLSLISACRR